MAKQKKLGVKLKTYYRGCLRKPIILTSDEDKSILLTGLRCTSMPLAENLKERKALFRINCKDHVSYLKVSYGLSSALRYIRQGKTKAVVCDESISPHLSVYLTEFCARLKAPVIQTEKLIDKVLGESARKNLKKTRKLLVLSFVDVDKNNAGRELVDSQEIENLSRLIKTLTDSISSDMKFTEPLVERIPTKGVNKFSKKTTKTKAT